MLGNAVEVVTAGQAESSTINGGPAPPPGTERIFAEVLADLMDVERVSADDHFFDDLGADSMVLARFCARVRKRDDLPAVSMNDGYQNPTIRGLATALADPLPTLADPPVPAPTGTPARPEPEEPTRASTLAFVTCGDLQFLLVDNIRTAHSREPFTGPRDVVVAMTDAVRLADCSPTVAVGAL